MIYTERKLAQEFSRGVREYIGEPLMTEVIRRNTEEYDESVCATHDFCDANMFMDAAMRDLGIVPVVDLDHDSPEQLACVELWNAAWSYARANQFEITDVMLIDGLREDALSAFWSTVVKALPEAKSGDLSVDRTMQLEFAAFHAIKEWRENNVKTV